MAFSKQGNNNKPLNDELRRFTNQFVQMNRDVAKKNARLVMVFVDELVRESKAEFYECYYTPRGSYFERLRVISANEFDFDICLHAFEGKCTVQGLRDLRTPDYKLVRLDNEDGIPNLASITRRAGEIGVSGNGRYVDASKLYSKFQGQVQRVLNKSDFRRKMNDRFPGFLALVRQHKPALTLALTANGYQEIDLDLCISIVFRGSEIFDMVPKEYPIQAPYSSTLWRLQYTEQERSKLDSLDAYSTQTCRKQCVRILKVLREMAPIPSPLKSHHLKILLFHELDKFPLSSDWEMDKLGERILGLLSALEEALRSRYLQYYFFPQGTRCNLFEYYSPAALQNCADRVRRIRNKLIVNPKCLQNPRAM